MWNRKSTVALYVFLLWPGLALAVGAPGPDSFGYTAAPTTNFSFLQITNGSPRVLWFDDDAVVTNVNLGFAFSFYGSTFSNVSLSVNGLMTFGGASTSYENVNFTTASPPDNLPSIAVLWDDWETQARGSDGIYYKTIGTAGSRQFIVQWNKVIPVNGSETNPVTFEARLFETSNRILLSYLQVVVVESNPVASLGAGATVGIRHLNGQAAGRNLQWSYNQAVINNGLNLLFAPPNQPPVINGAPTLTFTRTTTNTAVVSWPFPSTGFALEQNPTLGTTNWTSVTNSVSNDGSFNRVVVPANTGNKFYRLKK